MKDKIYELIANGQVGQYDLKMIADILKLESAGDFILLNKTLNELEDEYLIVRNSKNHYFLANQMQIYKGVISINSKGVGFIDLSNYSLKIKSSDLNGALDKDEVIVRANKRKLDEGYVEKVVKRNSENVVGYIDFNRKKVRVKLDNDRLKYLKVEVLNSHKYKLVAGVKALFRIVKVNSDKNIISLNIAKILGHKDDPGIDVLSILLERDIDPVFNEKVMNEANAISQTVLEYQKIGRKDFREEMIITIDGDDSKDFDDAISIKKIKNYYELGVHIADVSYYVPYNSQLDLEARKRGSSTYVVDSVVPMLPHILSNGICSLNPGVERLTISVIMKINSDGEVVDYNFYPSLIISKYRMTYSNVNKIFSGDKKLEKKYHDIYNMLYDIKDCASLIRNRREGLGSIDFDKNEAEIYVDDNGVPTEIKKRDRGISERIIEDFMICANEVVAQSFKYQGIPTLYRVHEEVSPKKIDGLKKIVALMRHPFKIKGSGIRPLEIQNYLNSIKDSEEYPIITTLMLRTMQKARYDSKPLGHFGLALENYLHFTSPIRRYPDLVVHRMMRKYFFENELKKGIEKDEFLMSDLAIETSNRERVSVEAEREVENMKMAEYMSHHINEQFDGIISSITKYGFYVELDNLIEGLVRVETLNDDYYVFDESTLSLVGDRTGKRFIMGQKLRVKVIKASKELRMIDFLLVKDNKQKLSRWR